MMTATTRLSGSSAALSLAVLLSAASLGVAVAGEPGSNGAVVHCYDAKRNVVTVSTATKCKGEVVSAERAAEIKAERAARIRAAMSGKKVPKAFAEKRRAGIGSGFFISKAGHVVTNYHVIDGCKAVAIETTTGKEVPAVVIATDKRHDLAVLKAKIAAPAIAVFRSPTTNDAGKDLFVVGYPVKTIPVIKPQLTAGKTMGSDDKTMRELKLPPWFVRMNAFVYPGNSGGPVLDASGGVFGVVVAQINTVKVFEKTGDLKRGVGFAIDNAYVFRFLDKHNIPYRKETAGEPMAEADLFAVAKPFVARTGCWK